MIRILFDGPPSHESGRFIEVENEKGESISLGEWIHDGDYWVLQFPDNRKVNADLLEALEDIAKGNAGIPDDILASGRAATTSYMWTYSQERARKAIADPKESE